MNKIIFDKQVNITYLLRHDDTFVSGGWGFPNTRTVLHKLSQLLATILGKSGFELIHKPVIFLLYGLQSDSNLVSTVDR